MNEKTLFDLKKGETAIVKNFNDHELPTKLYEIGILPGTKITIKYSGPFKDPICIGFGESESKLALRKKEAKSIIIEIV